MATSVYGCSLLLLLCSLIKAPAHTDANISDAPELNQPGLERTMKLLVMTVSVYGTTSWNTGTLLARGHSQPEPRLRLRRDANSPQASVQFSILNFQFSFALCALALSLAFCGFAAQTPSREYETRAVFLLHFARFTEWPSDAFTNKEQPLVIGVLGANPFDAFLSETVSKETVQGRKVVVAYYKRVEETKFCHILYISQSEAQRLDGVVSVFKGKPVLTVSDIEGADERGVIVRFEKEHNRIKLAFNLQAMKNARLNVSSKLLKLVRFTDSKK